MGTTRRALIVGLLAASLPLGNAMALSTGDAEDFVRDLGTKLEEIVSSASAGDPRAEAFLELFRRTTALTDIGRFTLGRHWQQMSSEQHTAFLDAFERYAARAYTNRLGDYDGQRLDVRGSQDVGRRGILVRSMLVQPNAQDLQIDWLVTDRNGVPQVVDIVAEGVSLSIAQREEFAGMIERRGGDYDRFIRDLDGLG